VVEAIVTDLVCPVIAEIRETVGRVRKFLMDLIRCAALTKLIGVLEAGRVW
jgi:hypothetical protein